MKDPDSHHQPWQGNFIRSAPSLGRNTGSLSLAKLPGAASTATSHLKQQNHHPPSTSAGAQRGNAPPAANLTVNSGEGGSSQQRNKHTQKNLKQTGKTEVPPPRKPVADHRRSADPASRRARSQLCRWHGAPRCRCRRCGSLMSPADVRGRCGGGRAEPGPGRGRAGSAPQPWAVGAGPGAGTHSMK